MSKYKKMVRGRCEIHVYPKEDGYVLEIPIVRVVRQGGFPQRVQEYLLDRNIKHEGPGTFLVRDGIIWYRSEAKAPHSLDETASRSVEVVERIGPKILNLLK
ncbi:MAG: hypothetical protein ACOX3V_06940 [Bacillota bacterium]